MRYLFGLCALLTLVFLGACQSVQPLPGSGLTGEEVPEDLTERYVHQVVGSLRDSFVSGDTAGFMKHVSDGFYKGHARLQESLEMEFRKGKALFLEASVVGMVDEDLRIVATVRWQRSSAPGESEMIRGETLFVFHKAEALSLVDFRNGSLFGISGF